MMKSMIEKEIEKCLKEGFIKINFKKVRKQNKRGKNRWK